jgi:UDP-N-acetylglucosamine--N-acetylmuramyl-(pentapeptide) pyrophosphoryl-undecaprenol N-acetylglucosamine transferase
MLKAIISGGGTGGHIFPALSIADKIKEKFPNSEIIFVGAKGKMEMEKIPAAGYKIIGLEIAGFQRDSIFKNIFLPFKIIKSILTSISIIKNYKPNFVVGVGGYASGPLLFAAQLKGIPTFIQEQNSFPGITNKFLSKRVRKICVAYPGLDKFFPSNKIVLTGNPIRKDILNLNSKKEIATKHFQLKSDLFTIFITGGSLGARNINLAVKNNINQLSKMPIQIIWQTGKLFFNEAIDIVNTHNINNIKVYEFVKEMDLAYAVSNLVISRAGAGAISELSVANKCCILVPLPTAAEDHQTKNAKSLADKNAAILVSNNNILQELPILIQKLINDNLLILEMEKNISEFAKPNAATEIVNVITKELNIE